MKQFAVEAVGHLPFLKIKKAPCEGARSCLLNSLINRYPKGYFFKNFLGTL